MSNEKLARRWAESRNPNSLSEDARAARAYILDHTTPQSMDEVAWSDEEHALAGAVMDIGGGPIDVVMLAGSVDGIDYATLNGKFGYEPRYYFTPNGKKYELVEVTDKPENPVEPSTKTMDEYTMAERADMVGMWAGYNRHKAGGEPTAFVIITGEKNEAGRVPCYNPGAPTPHAWAPDPWMLTPRFDMPRAWSTDGEPCEPTVSSNENVGADQPEHPETLETQADYENAPEGTIVAKNWFRPYVKNPQGVWTNSNGDRRPVERLVGTPRKVLRWGWGE